MSGLSPLQNKFLDLLLSSGALRFGEFKTKSGRTSPYFMNTGAFDHGRLLREVARCYAEFIDQSFPGSVHLYGPAYKGITLAAATAMELSGIRSAQVPFTFNRKEAKDHGEGGIFVGRIPDKSTPMLIIEDVMTGGTSIRETMALLTPREIPVRGVVIGIDRQERGETDLAASTEVTRIYGFAVKAILTMDEIIKALWVHDKPVERLGRIWIDESINSRIGDYRTTWGPLKT
jgi:orotate phosphoribosyltransferase